jgi:hypothetical protein
MVQVTTTTRSEILLPHKAKFNKNKEFRSWLVFNQVKKTIENYL